MNLNSFETLTLPSRFKPQLPDDQIHLYSYSSLFCDRTSTMKLPMEIILMDEILLITDQIRSYFPSCYALLEETPVIFNDHGKDIRDHELNQYLESIQTQWHHLIGRAAL